MFSIIDIIRRDNATYYDYESENSVGRAKTIAGFAILSVMSGFLVGQASNDFLTGALSAEAILVGFSFNVLFYLVANRLTKPATFASIEHELRFKRLSKLSDEVFDNITYFNLVAIFSAVSALFLLLTDSEVFRHNVHAISRFIEDRVMIASGMFGVAKLVGRSLGLAVLLFLLAESIYTFLRAVGRVRFYFGMLKTMNDDIAV